MSALFLAVTGDVGGLILRPGEIGQDLDPEIGGTLGSCM